MADHSALAVLLISLSVFVFFKYCLGHPQNADGLDAFRYDNVTRTVLRHVLENGLAGSAGAQLQFV